MRSSQHLHPCPSSLRDCCEGTDSSTDLIVGHCLKSAGSVVIGWEPLHEGGMVDDEVLVVALANPFRLAVGVQDPVPVFQVLDWRPCESRAYPGDGPEVQFLVGPEMFGYDDPAIPERLGRVWHYGHPVPEHLMLHALFFRCGKMQGLGVKSKGHPDWMAPRWEYDEKI